MSVHLLGIQLEWSKYIERTQTASSFYAQFRYAYVNYHR